VVIAHSSLTFRTIDPDADGDRIAADHLEACLASFGEASRYEGRDRYLAWVRRQVEEFPDGYVLAMEGGQCVGHLEIQVPYGKTAAYVNLFHVAPAFRGRGYAGRLQNYVERYARSWEANQIELHVSPSNRRALQFYRSTGYEFAGDDDRGARLWHMFKRLSPIV
jgi:ribosomal protein S18 acetylase RimI-like enzyme